MSSDDWTLDPDTEAAILLPWLNQEPDPSLRKQVLEWLASLVARPIGRGKEEEGHPGIFWARVPDTKVEVLWVLDMENRQVKLAIIDQPE